MDSRIAPYVCLGFSYRPGTDYNEGMMGDMLLREILSRWLISNPYWYEGITFAKTSAN